MRYSSTRAHTPTDVTATLTPSGIPSIPLSSSYATVPFSDAMLSGLAPDGGLFVPSEFPQLSEVFRKLNSESSFMELASSVFSVLLQEECSQEQIALLCQHAFEPQGYSFVPQIRTLEPDLKVLELFHGPSAAFKDYGAQFLATYLSHLMQEKDEDLCILTATSGDTGAAVARAFWKRPNMRVCVLYPSGRVSPLQERQFTTLGQNVHALEVKGSFDDCQRLVKQCFLDVAFCKTHRLSSANSINIGRLLPQSLYYIYAWLRAEKDPNLQFIVPSGNFGNLCAGLYAQKMGMNVRPFIAASNSNMVIPDYISTGLFKPRASIPTHATAMDVGDPSNFERIQYLFPQHATFSKHIQAYGVDDQNIEATIAHYYSHYNYFVCPHTATGLYLASRVQRDDALTMRMVLSTAHPAKFNDIVAKSCGHSSPIPQQLADLGQKKIFTHTIGTQLKELQDYIHTMLKK